MRAVLALLLFVAATPAAAREPMPYPPESRWASLPRLAMQPSFKPSAAWMEKASELQASGACSFTKGADGVTRIDIPFIVLLSAKGAVQDVHVSDTGCAELEAYVAEIAHGWGTDQVVPPQGPPPLWRVSRFLAGWRD